jgi:DNA-binding LacI/PurR family transcriptional regulator
MRLALGTLRALYKIQVDVPLTLLLAAYGSLDVVRYATPAISSVDLPVAEVGRVAA